MQSDIDSVNQQISKLGYYMPNDFDWSKVKYGDNNVTITVAKLTKPMGHFNDDGQWVDSNTKGVQKLIDLFPDTHLLSGSGDAAVDVNKNGYWLLQASDHSKQFGADGCKFDAQAASAFAKGSWGVPNWDYYVNPDGSLQNAKG